MKILVEEYIASRTVEELRALGHDVLDIRGTADQGLEDNLLWALGAAAALIDRGLDHASSNCPRIRRLLASPRRLTSLPFRSTCLDCSNWHEWDAGLDSGQRRQGGEKL